MGVLKYLLLGFTHPTELRALVTYAVWHDARDITHPKEHATSGWDREVMRQCWGLLKLTSRSFSVVIKELEGDLCRAVCIFYLVLRALDTVEDDMTLPNSVKLPLLQEFYTKLDQPGWNFKDSGPNEKDREALVQFQAISEEFHKLDEGYRKVIQDVCRRMGRGMASFAALSTPECPVAEVDSIADYDLYCHYVAGMVGEGLSGLFSASGKERPFLKDQLTLSNHMGLLLQKVNITRDFREDVDEGRGFWPRAIWSKYGFDKMGDLRDPEREKEALWALSEMILDALRHATPALDYLTLLKCQSVFNFVAIPAVMAMATLERCFGNPNVLRTNVKIRKGEAVKLMMGATNPRDVALTFTKYAKLIHSRIKVEDPNFVKLSIACGKIEQWTEHHYPTFVQVSPGSGGGGVQTTVSTDTGDARARLYKQIVDNEKAVAAAKRREEMLDRLRAKGLIKPKAEGGEAVEDEKMAKSLLPPTPEEVGGVPWALLAVVCGVLLGVVFISLVVVWGAVKYFD